MMLDNDHSVSHPKRLLQPTSLNKDHIAEAIHRSFDNGATLVFSKMNLTEVGVLAAEELASVGRETPEDESAVKRIALGNNHLSTLPTEFALLSCLRYLNLKRNNFSIFPDVITLMPSLDTLDISCNKIKKFPTQAGQLVHLRVFCISRNKITRLPPYLMQFHNLEVLQVDRNPLEWPPRSVLDHKHDLKEEHSNREWVKRLQIWMEAHTPKTKMDDDLDYSDSENTIDETYNTWRFPIQENGFNTSLTPHVRSFSVDSNISFSSIAESLQDPENPDPTTERPPPLHLGILQSYSAETSPTHSSGSYLPSPVDSEAYLDDNAIADMNHLETQYHARNSSYSGELNTSRAELWEKKSMPDLRTAKLSFTKKYPNLPHPGPSVTPISDVYHENLSMSSSFSQRQDSGSFLNSSSLPRKSQSSELSYMPSTRTVPSMAFERNSYFRRLSTLPTSISLPKPLLRLIDAARSILFAMCQVYQTLEHYMIHAIDDRLSSVLRKVLDPASTDMMQLINSLDRFDVMSRKTLPPPIICRSVVESCRDTVAVFGKAIGVLGLQLKVIATGDDVRYSRWILLELYASTVEICCAWQAMVPYIDAIKPLLRAKTFSTQLPLMSGETFETPFVQLPPMSAPVDSSIAQRPYPTGLNMGSSSATVSRARTARRHAGSFSSKDVEIGKKLPSYDDAPSMFGGIVSGVATQTPTLRTPKRQTTVPLSLSSATGDVPLSSTFTTLPNFGSNSRVNHSRQGSQVSLQTSSSSSPSAPSKTTFLDLPSNSRTQVDKEAVQAVQAAVNVAPLVWDMMEESLGDLLDTKSDVRETLEKARVVTTRLSEAIQTMQEADSIVDRRVLREDAHVFLKMVVQLSNVIKTYGRPHAVSSALRTNMVKLTNSTEEFAILLHVSSFSPSISKSYSPMFNTSTALGNSSSPEENRLGSNLSRSRSAQPLANFRLPPQDSIRRALPGQSFNAPTIRQLRGKEARTDIADPE